jgi:hypothetical protein
MRREPSSISRKPCGKVRIVPPSDQAAAVLRETPAIHRAQLLRPLSGERNAGRPMSENAVNAALYRVGFARTHDGAQLPGYGFDPAERNGLSAGCHRAPARTCGTEQGANRLQPRSISDRAQEDDAGMGGLLGRVACRKR